MAKLYNYKMSGNKIPVLRLSHDYGMAHKPVVTGSDKRKENPSSVSTRVTAPRGSCFFVTTQRTKIRFRVGVSKKS